MAKNIILLLDTQNKSDDLVESFNALNVSIEMITNSNHLAQHLAVGDSSAAVANIHHNDEFELL
ncbi:hypothetical protein KJ865_17030, partial [Myxococcota bacterium]|nr:hypothetical protein [Myxococcota bacterium]